MKLSKEELISTIKVDIPDNTTGEISPLDIRRNLINIIDSVSRLTVVENLHANNLETPDVRSTRLGLETHSKRAISAFGTADDVAVGFAASKSQIEAARNVAVGSFALTCNMYGEDNVAVGYHSVGNNIAGYANIGLGAFSLANNKDGNFNIAIGHGAGYYISENDTHRFYLGPHPVDSDYVCDNPNGTGLVPFLMGDMDPANTTLRLGIGIRDFVDTQSALQLAGGISPSVSDAYDIGTVSHRFRNIHISDGIYFKSDSLIYDTALTKFTLSNDLNITGTLNVTKQTSLEKTLSVTGNTTIAGDLTANGETSLGTDVYVGGHFRPQNDIVQVVGDAQKRWLSAHIYNLYVDGVGKFNRFEAIEQTHFKNKTLYLASTGDITSIDGGGETGLYDYYDPSNEEPYPEPQMLDEDLNEAGIKIKAKGVDYKRTYSFGFKSQNTELANLQEDNAFSRSSWNSNISLSVDNGRHVQTQRILSKDQLNLSTYNHDGFGLYMQNGVGYFSPEHNIATNRVGDGDWNFIAHSGLLAANTGEFAITVSAPQSGVNLFQRFLNDTDAYTFDKGVEQWDGFQMGYISTSDLPQPAFFNEQAGQNPKRFIISSYNQSAYAKRCFMLLQDGSEGYVGVSNFDNSESMLPDTIFNVRSTGNAIIRTTAENDSNHTAGLEILADENCLKYGMAIHYIKNSGTVDFDYYDNGDTYQTLTVGHSGHLAILDRAMGCPEAMLSLGDEDNSNAFIGIREASGVPTAVAGYGQLFTRHIDEDVQSTNLSFVDSSGNLFNVNLVASSADGFSDRAVALDGQGNTFVGIRAPDKRSNIVSTTERNTFFGYESLTNIGANATDNTAFGYRAGKGISSGDGNVFVGSNLTSAADDGDNIVLGTGITTSYSNSIVMGHGTPTVRAKTDGIDKFFGANNALAVFPNANANSSNTLVQQNSTHYKLDTINFAGNSFGIDRKYYESDNEYTVDVIGIDCTNDAPTATENYAAGNNQTVKVNADLQVRGEIFFPNGTKIPNANFIAELDNAEANITTNSNAIAAQSTRADGIDARIDALIIEGVVTTIIQPSPNNRGGDWPSDPITVGSTSDDKLRFYIKRKVVNGSSQFVDADSAAVPPSEIEVTLRDPNIAIYTGDYVIAIKIGNEYRPISITGQN